MRIATPLRVLAFVLTLSPSHAVEMDQIIREDFAFAAEQYRGLLKRMDGKDGLPRTFENNQLAVVPSRDWTSGFFPGSMWYLYEFTRDPQWKDAAAAYTARVEPEQHNTRTHDVGFMLWTSAGNGLRLTGNTHYRDVMITGAKSLTTRFSEKVGSIRSWDRQQWKFPVIIDNMMNLQLLYWAANATKEARFAEIATTHANTSLKNLYRPDFSCFHVVNFDPETGAVVAKFTHQGIADDSAWARGQAWGLYGFTVVYRKTGDAKYLEHAKKVAAFLMSHPRMPEDKIPYWDYDDKRIPNAPRDASAAAIMASALIDLSGCVDGELGSSYLAFAEKQLRSLSSPAYRAKLGENGNFILMHSTGNHPKNSEIDTPINYADYYFLEGLLRFQAQMKKATPGVVEVAR
jgi:unsaturated chondroitin disaccharide hydrolase